MKREEWLDGLRGIACLIVMMGHCFSIIAPALYFGTAYETDRSWEYMLHASPLKLLWNGPTMVPVFFVISGYLLAKTIEKNDWLTIVVKRYIRFLPMVLIAVISTFIVMRLGLVYSIPLVEYSKSVGYADAYNNFGPSLKGAMFDAVVKTFLTSSAYVGPLWYLGTEFIGTILISLVGRILYRIKKRQLNFAIWLILIVVFVQVEKYDWKMAYIVAMILGIVLSQSVFLQKLPVWMNRILMGVALFALSTCSWLERIHISFQNVWVQIVAAFLLVVTIKNEKWIKKLLSQNVPKWLGKQSFAIYAMHWLVVISIVSGITYFLATRFDYFVAVAVGSIACVMVTIGISPIVTSVYSQMYRLLDAVANWGLKLVFKLMRRENTNHAK